MRTSEFPAERADLRRVLNYCSREEVHALLDLLRAEEIVPWMPEYCVIGQIARMRGESYAIINLRAPLYETWAANMERVEELTEAWITEWLGE